MTRYGFAVVWLSALSSPLVVDAQHHSHSEHNHRSNGAQRTIPLQVHAPYVRTDFYGSGFHRNVPYFGGPYIFTTYYTQPAPVVLSPVSYTPLVFEPAKPAAVHSSPAARLKSLDFQARGDQKMREQKWSEARAAYASAISAAPDRAEAHMRLGVCYVTIQRFDWAVREFKRALVLDPMSAKNAKSLKEIFGADSQIIRTSVVSKLEDWVQDDIHSSERLFLLGAILHLDGHPHGREVLETAIKMKTASDTSHIATFLNPRANAMQGKFAGNGELVPELNDRVVPVLVARPFMDLRFPKSTLVPMPDGPFPLPDAPVPMP